MFWGDGARTLAEGADPGPSLRFWVERFMLRGRRATLSEVVGNFPYAKPPVPRRGIKVVAQNRRGGKTCPKAPGGSAR